MDRLLKISKINPPFDVARGMYKRKQRHEELL